MVGVKEEYVLAADIGGTNINMAIVATDSFKILYQQKTHTDKILPILNHFLTEAKQRGFTPRIGCFSVAGPVQGVANRWIKVPCKDVIVKQSDIEKNTSLQQAIVINDFEAVGWSVNVLKGKQLKIIRAGDPLKGGNKAVIGAGTGLGNGLLINRKTFFEPVPSEGGRGDFPVQTDEEYTLLKHVRKQLQGPVMIEHLVSGPGIERIYAFLRQHYYRWAPQSLSASDIFATKRSNKCSTETVKLFTIFYARACKSFAFDVLPRAGLYIAGGVAMKNPEILNKAFLKEFEEQAAAQYRQVLRKIPITLITDYDCSLYGAAYAAVQVSKG